ncbi:hypothetical protein CJ179_38570 [Rhodococcus sp. ACS1]|nr:hypothetical protein CJ179_38570 [Rhodococcus sp. ACS1]
MKMAKVKDFAPTYVSANGAVLGWDTPEPIVLDVTNPDDVEVIMFGRSWTRAEAEAIILGLSGALMVASSRTRVKEAA